MKRMICLTVALALLGAGNLPAARATGQDGATAALVVTGVPQQSAQPGQTATPAPDESTQAQTAPAYGVNLLYDRYATWDFYYVALQKTTVHTEASAKSKAITSLAFGQRVPSEAATQDIDGVSWLKVTLDDGAQGYVNVANGDARAFRHGQAFALVKELEASADSPFTVRISNYRNANGRPPALANGASTDEYENRRDTGAGCYTTPDSSQAPVRYAPDGLLGRQYEQYNGFTRVYFPSFGDYYWVPDKYVSTRSAVSDLTQAIVVDRKFQNLCMFERDDAGQWTLIAMNYVTTGKEGGSSLKTPLGEFSAIERKHYFYYDNEGDDIVDGYALWAIRFSAGGYTHGVPTSSKQDPVTGEVYVGGSAEGQSTLGTVPKSHMCIRNYTSFAKFMYDRTKIGNCAVIVFE
ncbi:MAG: L,D-transpeptidase family protein [Eubacteriales bacterium]|nr:L,D-transpeptidase family protein [Eubacteriales bacterium]